MKPVHQEARLLAERFASERLDRMQFEKAMEQSARELREAAFSWIEFHLEKRLTTRELLETA